MGRLSMRRCPIVSVDELRVVSTSSAVPLTLTTTCEPSTASATGRSALPPTVIATFCASALAKPLACTTTEYVPGGSSTTRYSPSILTVVDLSSPFAWSRTVTVALVTRFPCGSFTVTCRSPVATPCPNPNPVSNTMKTASETSFRVVIQSSPVGDSQNHGLSELLRQPLVQT